MCVSIHTLKGVCVCSWMAAVLVEVQYVADL